MKITLRKMSKNISNNLEITQNKQFNSVALPPGKSAVSFSNNENGYSFVNAYGIDWHKFNDADSHIRFVERNVIKIDGHIKALVVPSTHASNSKSIIKFTKQICDYLYGVRYFHFTHFGYLRTAFPVLQIKKILNIFLENEDIDCEICWDIDQKFFDNMYATLLECLRERGNNALPDCHDKDTFQWSKEFDALIELKRIERLAKQERQRVEYAKQRFIEKIDRLRNISDLRSDLIDSENHDGINLSTKAIEEAGKLYVQSLLIRKGFITSRIPDWAPKYDFILFADKYRKKTPLKIETIGYKNYWLISKRDVFDEDMIYCFVRLEEFNLSPRLYIVPSYVVDDVTNQGEEIQRELLRYWQLPDCDFNKKSFEINFSSIINDIKDPDHYLSKYQMNFIHTHSYGWLEKYEQNFDLLNRAVR